MSSILLAFFAISNFGICSYWADGPVLEGGAVCFKCGLLVGLVGKFHTKTEESDFIKNCFPFNLNECEDPGVITEHRSNSVLFKTDRKSQSDPTHKKPIVTKEFKCVVFGERDFGVVNIGVKRIHFGPNSHIAGWSSGSVFNAKPVTDVVPVRIPLLLDVEIVKPRLFTATFQIRNNPSSILADNVSSLNKICCQKPNSYYADNQAECADNVEQSGEVGHLLLGNNVSLSYLKSPYFPIFLILFGGVVGGSIGGYGFYRLLDGLNSLGSYFYCIGGVIVGLLIGGLGILLSLGG